MEIERKFLVVDESWRIDARKSIRIRQGYFATDPSCSIRIRISDNKASLNIKSATLGITRSEYDYPVPISDAEEMLEQLCVKPLLEKERYIVEQGALLWEIDVFSGVNAGLIVAEIELESDQQDFDRPSWLGQEVSDDPRYYNVCLVANPYNKWKESK